MNVCEWCACDSMVRLACATRQMTYLLAFLLIIVLVLCYRYNSIHLLRCLIAYYCYLSVIIAAEPFVLVDLVSNVVLLALVKVLYSESSGFSDYSVPYFSISVGV